MGTVILNWRCMRSERGIVWEMHRLWCQTREGPSDAAGGECRCCHVNYFFFFFFPFLFSIFSPINIVTSVNKQGPEPLPPNPIGRGSPDARSSSSRQGAWMPGGGATPNFPDDDLRPSPAAPSPSQRGGRISELSPAEVVLCNSRLISAPFPFLSNRSLTEGIAREGIPCRDLGEA
ncbi:hypothetical protein BJX96DRAFT_32175 [Aspergillus floccosus]